jgi:hypothetical protein
VADDDQPFDGFGSFVQERFHEVAEFATVRGNVPAGIVNAGKPPCTRVISCISLGEGSFSPSAFARLDLQPLASAAVSPVCLRDAELKRVENPRQVQRCRLRDAA